MSSGEFFEDLGDGTRTRSVTPYVKTAGGDKVVASYEFESFAQKSGFRPLVERDMKSNVTGAGCWR